MSEYNNFIFNGTKLPADYGYGDGDIRCPNGAKVTEVAYVECL